MKNKIVKFGSENHQHGIMWKVVFENKIPGTDFIGFSVFREFSNGPGWLKSDVHVAGVCGDFKVHSQNSFEIWQTRDQEALQVCKLIANNVICFSEICSQGGIEGKVVDMLLMPAKK